MSTQSFGSATAINPPVTIDGASYSFAVEFNRFPTNRTDSTIVAGETDSASALSGNRKKVLCSRGYQSASYTLILGFGNSMEVAFQWLGGGNICASSEPERIYQWNNSHSIRGGDSRGRAIAGDMLWIVVGGVAKGFLITEATPFSEAPASVNYVGDVPKETTTVFSHAPNGIALPNEDGCEVVFSSTAVDGYSDCLVQYGTGFTGGPVTRRIFQRGDPLADDEYYYPNDAEFSPTVPEYWFDPLSRSFRFGTIPMGLAAATELYVLHYQRREDAAGTVTPETTAQPVILEADAGSGYAGTADVLCSASAEFSDDLTVVLDVSYGAGAIELRSSSLASSRVVALEWDADGDVLGKRQRSTDGGSIGALSGTGGSYTFPMQVRIVRTGTSVVFSHRQNSAAAWVAETALTINYTSGRIGVATSLQTKFSGVAVALALVPLGSTGALAVQRIAFESSQAWSQTYTLPVATSVISVTNEKTGAAMVAGTTIPTRNNYVLSGTSITFFSECAGDRIAVLQAAPGSAPAGPGRPPSSANTVNFATMSGVDGVATTVLSENIANYRDVLIIHDPLDEFPTGAGQAFTVRRDPVFDSQNPPTLQWDVKTRALHDWTTISASDYVLLAAEGIAFFKASFITGTVALTGAETLCIRATGNKFSQRGGISAGTVNEAINALEAMDDAWLYLSNPGSGIADAVSGVTSSLSGRAFTVYPTAWTCDGSGNWNASALAYGSTKAGLQAVSDLLSGAGATPPAYFYGLSLPDTLERFDTVNRTLYTTASDSTLDCNGTPKQAHDVNAAGNYEFSVYPGSNIGPTGTPISPGLIGRNYFGGMVLPSGFGNHPYLPAVHAEFGFSGIPFNVPSWFARLPDGCTIIAAKLLAKFDGLAVATWSQVYDVTADGGGNFAVRNFTHTREGVLCYSWDGTTAYRIPVLPTTPSTGAVTFALMGRRKRSSRVYLYDGTLYGVPVADDTIDAIGSGIASSSAGDGVFKSIDVTGMMQRLYNLRNSLYSSFELWPTVGVAEPDVADTGLGGYLRSLMPAVTATLITGTLGRWGYTSTQSGRYASFDSLEVGAMVLRIRLPSGQLSDRVLPVNEPPFVAALT